MEKIIIDTSFLVALLNANDNLHSKAKEAFFERKISKIQLYDYIYSETLTVLRYKAPEHQCESFLRFIAGFQMEIYLSNQKKYSLATQYFHKHKKLSFVDCLIIATAKLENATILTFDKQLQKAFKLS